MIVSYYIIILLQNNNVSWGANQHIRIISERYDAEDCSNDAENSALPSQELIAFENILKLENTYFKL